MILLTFWEFSLFVASQQFFWRHMFNSEQKSNERDWKNISSLLLFQKRSSYKSGNERQEGLHWQEPWTLDHGVTPRVLLNLFLAMIEDLASGYYQGMGGNFLFPSQENIAREPWFLDHRLTPDVLTKTAWLMGNDDLLWWTPGTNSELQVHCQKFQIPGTNARSSIWDGGSTARKISSIRISQICSVWLH